MICRQLEANVLITEEVATQVLSVEAILHHRLEQDFIAIVFRQAEEAGPVRSHFERLDLGAEVRHRRI